MILDLIDGKSPELTQESTPFDFDGVFDATELFENLKETMIEHRGVGLSAVQCGIPLRVFVLGNWNDPDTVMSVFNPRIVDQSKEMTVEEEGCLTFPGLYVKVKRHDWIRVRYTTHEGVTDTIKLGGMTARIFQHEMDHLNGILYTRKANRYHLEQAQKQKKKLDKLRRNNRMVA